MIHSSTSSSLYRKMLACHLRVTPAHLPLPCPLPFPPFLLLLPLPFLLFSFPSSSSSFSPSFSENILKAQTLYKCLCTTSRINCFWKPALLGHQHPPKHLGLESAFYVFTPERNAHVSDPNWSTYIHYSTLCQCRQFFMSRVIQKVGTDVHYSECER